MAKLPPQGKARDIVAKEMGYSGKTIDKMAAVVNKVEELENQGRFNDADLIKSVLNNQSVEAASNLAKNIDNLSSEVKTAIYEGKTTVSKAIKTSSTAQENTSAFIAKDIEKKITPTVDFDTSQNNSVEEISEFESLLDGVGMSENKVQEITEILMQHIYSGEGWKAIDLVTNLVYDAEKKLNKLNELGKANSNSEDLNENPNEDLADWLSDQLNIQESRRDYLEEYLQTLEKIFVEPFDLPNE